MKFIRRKNNQLVLEEIDLKTSTAIARAITMKPELVHTRIHQVVNASDYGQLLRSFISMGESPSQWTLLSIAKRALTSSQFLSVEAAAPARGKVLECPAQVVVLAALAAPTALRDLDLVTL